MRDAAASMAGSTAHEPVPWFDALYRQGWPRLVRLAWVFTGRHDAAEDRAHAVVVNESDEHTYRLRWYARP